MHTRRRFLTDASAAALAAAIAAKTPARAQEASGEWRNRVSEMAYRRLGRTGYMISEVVMGGNTISPTSYEHVLAAIDQGLNYLDTAPAYGKTASEQGYARVLKARSRDKVFLNSKVSIWDQNRNMQFRSIFDSLPGAEQNRLQGLASDVVQESKAAEPDYFVDYFSSQRQELEDAALANVMERQFGRRIDRGQNYRQIILKSVDESLARLGTDHLDLLMCPHGVNTPFELQNYPEIFEAFESLKKAGKVRHFGISSHTDPAANLNAAIDSGVYSAAMVAYNAVNRARLEPVLERAKRRDVGLIAMKVAKPFAPSGQSKPAADRLRVINELVPGDLKPAQKAYAWALRNPNLSAVISEMVTADHVKDNLPLAAPAKR
ncbi:MAG TPA: aldo/keto reductase [Bryobacteraceae bacterium]|nr:aldo/keto reductase [Bryobacteraceae bacterium]